MFYCDQCAEEAGWPVGGGVPRSRGPCECCEVVSINTDIPSRALPQAKVPMYRKAIWERRGWTEKA